MAPGKQQGREESIERSDEYDEFIARLQEFHNKRGTTLDREPKVGWHRVDHLRLYKRIVEEGGYDHVSDTRASPLAWRRIGIDMGYGNENTAALAFTLKTAYYKNLAAFEIADHHKKEPPPKEILEDVSAKGGNIMGRTLDNYSRPISRDVKWTTNGVESEDGDGEGHGTPKEDRMDIDEPGSLGARSSRGLRQAPPQRQLFQSDVTMYRPSSRQQQASQTQSPGPPLNPYASTNGTYPPQTAAQALANYEPKTQIPLTLRPVTTPGNNPELFKATQMAIRDAALARSTKYGLQPKSSPMLPGTGFSGANVYIRTFMGLKSGVPEEQDYALHHLVKISHERGDKYRFDNFSGLAEALVDKVLEAASLFYHVKWQVSYQGTTSETDFATLDGLNGTPNILDKIKRCEPRPLADQMETRDMNQDLKLINEAGLVLRNMSMLQENAEYLSRYPSIRDALTIILNLPADPCLYELKQYCHDVAEQLARHMVPSPDDPLLNTLLAATTSTDRGVIISSLRALSRVGTYFQQIPPIQTLPASVMRQVNEWLLVEDQDLRAACLDLLYRYTTVIDNLEALLHQVNLQALVRQLVRLLQFGARTDDKQSPNVAAKATPRLPTGDASMDIPQIPKDLVEQLLGYDEPERSSQWLKTCFEEDPSGEITQIALWQAYQLPFAPCSALRPLLPAKDFITNVSHTFAQASAQVQGQFDPPKFVIKGIKPRPAPVDPRGRLYMRCQWILENDSKCPEFAPGPKQLWEHIVSKHLHVVKDSDGQYEFTTLDETRYKCCWNGCHKFDSAQEPVSLFATGMHVKTHLPDASNMAYQRSKSNLTPDQQAPPVTGISRSWAMHNTMTDERHDAAGLPLMSALILRNLARNMPRTNAAANRGKDNLMRSLFAPVKEQLYYVMAYNRSLGEYLSTLTRFIDAEEVAA